MKKNVMQIFLLYLVLFLICVGYLFIFVITGSKRVVTNPTNPRMRLMRDGVVRGNIYDQNDTLLVTSEDNGRQYLYPDLFAHITGFEHNKVYNTKCIESEYFFSMQKLDNEIFRRITNVFGENSPLLGNSVVLTIDKDVQKLAYDSLKSTGLKGAIVAIEPSTGKVLAMVSSPVYNLDNIDKILSAEERGDDFNSPLINRATQGRYPPGSTFKIVTAVSAMENLDNPEEITYNCTGKEFFESSQIRCFNEQAHGTLDIKKAFTVSCNTYFANLGNILGSESLTKTADNFYFSGAGNKYNALERYYFPLERSLSSFSIKSDEHLEQTAIGQGDTVVTPLHMAMITSAVGNGGVMMKPYIVDHIKTYSGRQINKTMPSMLGQITSPETAFALKGMMVEAVNEGTGTKAKIDGVAVAGKTGTAQITATDNVAKDKSLSDHAWFVGFAPADNPDVCVAVILENGENGRYALPIARKILNYYVRSE